MIQGDRVETVFLYDRPAPADMTAITLELNAACAKSVQPFEARLPASGSFVLLDNGAYHVVIRHSDRPCPPESFIRALDAPVTQTGRIKFAPRLRRHRAALSVCVGVGSLSPDRQDGAIPAINPDDRSDVAVTRQLLCLSHRVARAVLRGCVPLAVHWKQSNRLLLPEQILDEAKRDIPLSYTYNPAPFSSGTRLNGRVLSGMRALGSEWIAGRTLVLHENSLSLGQGGKLIEDIMQLSLDGTSDLGDGRKLRIGEWPACTLRQRPPTVAYPAGTLEIMLRDDIGQKPGPRDEKLRRVFGRARDARMFSRSLGGMRAAFAR